MSLLYINSISAINGGVRLDYFVAIKRLNNESQLSVDKLWLSCWDPLKKWSEADFDITLYAQALLPV